MRTGTLFLLTKTFPYGNAEQYLEEELTILSDNFENIILVPCSIFGNGAEMKRKLPSNCETFLVNNSIGRKSIAVRLRNFFEWVSILLEAVIHNRDGFYFYRNLRRSSAILRQQQACAESLKLFIEGKNVDISKSVFYSYWVHSSCIILGVMKRRKWITSFITRAHSYDLYHQDFFVEKEKSPLPWEYFKFKSVKSVYCISEHGAAHLGKKYPKWKSKFMVSRLGVKDSARSNPDKRDEKYFRIVTCSSVQFLKQVDRLPEILSFIDFPVEWVHFGTGDNHSLEQLQEACDKYKKEQHQFRLMGHVNNEKVKKYYADVHIDLFLNLSLAEGVPVSLMEAAAFGIPLLATDVYGTPEIARPECGFLVTKNFRAEEIAVLIRKLKEDEVLCAKLRLGAVSIQQKFFNAENNYREFVNELKRTA